MKKAFTLIELVVVMVIIALLSTLVISGILLARKILVDRQRVNITRTVEAALEGRQVTCGSYLGPLLSTQASQNTKCGYMKIPANATDDWNWPTMSTVISSLRQEGHLKQEFEDKFYASSEISNNNYYHLCFSSLCGNSLNAFGIYTYSVPKDLANLNNNAIYKSNH